MLSHSQEDQRPSSSLPGSSVISSLEYMIERLSLASGELAQPSLVQIPQTDGELHDAIRRYVGISIPDKAVCNDHVSPFEAFCNAFFARDPVAVWKASRGFGGKTVQLAILSYAELILLGASVNLLGGSGEQSGRAYKYISGDETNLPDTFWDSPYAPRELLLGEITQKLTRLTNGGRLSVLMASQRSVRGPHPQRLRLDEADEIDIDILDSALGQPMGARGITAQTVISSTHQYSDGTMTEMIKRAGLNGWPVFEWCYRETMEEPNGWLAQDEVRTKKLTVTKAMWDTEYELQEPSPELRAIDPESVALMFKRELGVYEGAQAEYIEIEPPMIECSAVDCTYEIAEPEDKEERQRIIKMEVCPVCGDKLKYCEYATGADWAKKKDYTVIITFRKKAPSILDPAKRVLRLVAFERINRLPWPVMTKKLDQRVNRFWGRPAHDGTGLGDVVADNLTVNAENIILVGRTRSDIFSEYITAIEGQEIEAPYIEFMETEHRLCSTDDLYRAGVKFHPPDSIVAGSLGYYASRFSKGVF